MNQSEMSQSRRRQGQASKSQEGDSDMLRAHLQHSASCRTSGLFVPVGNPRKFDRRLSKPIRNTDDSNHREDHSRKTEISKRKNIGETTKDLDHDAEKIGMDVCRGSAWNSLRDLLCSLWLYDLPVFLNHLRGFVPRPRASVGEG